MNSLISLTLLSVLLSSFASWANAQNSSERREESVFVTGSRLPAPERQTDLDVSIIMQPNLLDGSASGGLDVLRNQSGLVAIQQSPTGSASFVSIRGGDENFVQVLIDGVKVNDPTDSAGGAFDFNLLDPIQIESVEVFRRSGSSVYGSDGLSGLISIRTRRSEDEHKRAASLRLDSEQAFSGGYLTSGPVLGGSGSAALSYRDGGTQIDGDRYTRTGGHANFERRIGSHNDVSAAIFLASSDIERYPDTGGGPRFAETDDTETLQQDLVVGGLNLSTEVSGTQSIETKINVTHSTLDQNAPAIIVGGDAAVPANFAETEFRRVELTSSYNLAIADVFGAGSDVDLVWGAGFLSEDGESIGGVDFGVIVPADFELSRNAYSGFAEVATRFDSGLRVFGSARFDDPEDASSEVTFGAGLVYALKESGTVFDVSWGEGFKLPSFFALGSPLVGNPDLVPEESEIYSATLRQDLGNRVTVRIGVYDAQYTNLVEFDPDAFTNVNLGGVDVQGLEFEVSAQPKDTLFFSANLDLSDTDLSEPGTTLRFRPDLKGSAALRWEPNADWQLGTGLRYVGDVTDFTLANGAVELDAYWTQDLYAQLRVSSDWRLRIDLRNLADESYEESFGYPARGRNVSLSLTSDF